MRITSNGIVLELPVASNLASYAKQHKDKFLNSTQGLGEISSTIELCSRFILHIATDCGSPGNYELIQLTWEYLERELRCDLDIHTLVAAHIQHPETQLRTLGLYFSAQYAAGGITEPPTPALIQAQRQGKAVIYGLFGGQGIAKNYFNDIQNAYIAYALLIDDLLRPAARVLATLSRDPRVRDQFSEGLDVLQWLEDPESVPSSDYLLSAPVSFPLIGLLQLISVKSILASCGLDAADFPSIFRGLAGHSQGIIVAAAISQSSSWHLFTENSIHAITILFWIGCRSQQYIQGTSIFNRRSESKLNGAEVSTPMLSVSQIQLHELELALDIVNSNIPTSHHLLISLYNSDTQFVISGPERGLLALSQVINANSSAQGPSGPENSKCPSIRFLPISIPCHGKWLDEVLPLIDDDLKDIFISPSSLTIPVNQTADGSKLGSSIGPTENLVPLLVRFVTSVPVNWDDVEFTDSTHVVDFGPGSLNGIGSLVQSKLRGQAVRVISTGYLKRSEPAVDLGSLCELTSPFKNDVRWNLSWESQNRISLVRTNSGLVLASKLSRLLGLPPIFVAGMTPTTTHPEFVAAIMRAGYHVEFAAGGYHDAGSLRHALYKLESLLPPGRTITVNVIYVNPRALAWQIPLVREMRGANFPISGLTIGGGIPSIGVATEYITTLGIDHISFKPSSPSSILQVVEIARKNPSFPIILQWTGGRGGGHHSTEDFHAPILETYTEIRTCPNLILVAGSGFGSAEGVSHYLSGTWGHLYGKKCAMPFDGVLLGSRVMACAEAHTSSMAKAAIARAPGVPDSDWKRTMAGVAGGITSIRSEMGEPMHVIGNRAARFWAELDAKIFSLERKKRGAALQASRRNIISRLNIDSHRPWFGRKSDGSICDLAEMTYAEVANRLLELTFAGEWINESYQTIFASFLRRIKARFENSPFSRVNVIGACDPSTQLTQIILTHPESVSSQIGHEDQDFFLKLCKAPKTKPPPFIPILNDDFEVWFKKDSLWQSENLQYVHEQDVERVLILQGPVAASYTRVVDEPVEDILNSINHGVIQDTFLSAKRKHQSSVPVEEFLLPGYLIGSDPDSSISSGPKSETQAGLHKGWVIALLNCCYIYQPESHHTLIENPFSKLLKATRLNVVEHEQSETVSIYAQLPDGLDRVEIAASKVGFQIHILIHAYVTASERAVSMALEFEYHPEASYAPIWKPVGKKRDTAIRNAYRKLWAWDDSCSVTYPQEPSSIADFPLLQDSIVINSIQVKAFSEAIGYNGPLGEDPVPLDFAIMVAWRGICRAILQDPVLGDFLRLVHLSNHFQFNRSSKRLEVGDSLQTLTSISSIQQDNRGKVVEVTCRVCPENSDVASITVCTRFLFRERVSHPNWSISRRHESPYELQVTSPSDIAVLKDKAWLLDDEVSLDELNSETTVLEFHMDTDLTRNYIVTSGKVYVRSEAGGLSPMGTIEYKSDDLQKNDVLSFLSRRGCIVKGHQIEQLAEEHEVYSGSIQTPECNEAYSRASGDFNPIHTSEVFAQLAGLPGTITHGMYCSAVVRNLVEKYAAGQDPNRFESYDVAFVGMVLPNQQLNVSIRHTGMHNGLKVFIVDVRESVTGLKVLQISTSIAQAPTTLLFTGQGSQSQNMGMDLYSSSSVARAVWDRADAYFQNQFGLSLLQIVRDNSKTITVQFGGIRGRKLRHNYLSLHYEMPPNTSDTSSESGKAKTEPMFPTLHDQSASFTHSSRDGLLFSTEFSQPALAVMEIARFKHMQAAGVLVPDCYFAGHSLGEYVALACKTEFMSFDNLLYVLFCRGLTMRNSVERDRQGKSGFSMIAVDPSRVRKDFLGAHLPALVDEIRAQTGFFIEIVNLNISNKQYVCAGDLRGLDLLQRVCDTMKSLSFSPGMPDNFQHLVADHISLYTGRLVTEIELKRGSATVPLPGIDLPFHSSYLRPRMEGFRQVLLENVNPRRLALSILQDRYIPNLTGKPFSISRDYFEEVWKVTGSDRIGRVLGSWGDWMQRIQAEKPTE